MPTYGNYFSSESYRPHLDDVSFLRFLRVAAIVILVLSIGFSVRGNYKGLGEGNLENMFLWRVVLSFAVPLTSSFLSMVTFARINLRPVGRVMIGIVAVILFYVSARWIYAGFVGSERDQVANIVQENPQIVQAKRELDRIIERQAEYGLSRTEKIRLMEAEKAQREYLNELTRRLMIENRNAKSNLEAAIGDERKIALTLFAAAPEVCTAVISSLLVYLFGAGVRRREDEVTNNMALIQPNISCGVDGKFVQVYSNQGENAIDIKDQANEGNGTSRAVLNWRPF